MNLYELLQLARMLRELDLEKNDNETIREVLDFIALNIEHYVKNMISKI